MSWYLVIRGDCNVVGQLQMALPVVGRHCFADMSLASFVSFFSVERVSLVLPTLSFVQTLVWCSCFTYKAGKQLYSMFLENLVVTDITNLI
jgi:hypothetical protein